MHNDQSSPNELNPKKKYDLEDRTFNFAVSIVKLAKSMPQDVVNKPIVNQVVRSGTSISANYCEADEANSKKDFINKIAIAKKETKETKFWLRLIAETLETYKLPARELFREAQELNLIFAAIIRNSNSKE